MQRIMSWRLAVLATIMALALTTGRAQSAGAAGNAVLLLQPTAVETTIGSEVVVEMAVCDVESLFGFEAHLSFDALLLEVVDAAPAQNAVQAELMSSFAKPDFVVLNQADNSAGIIDLAFTQLAPSAPVTGAGTIATITFRAKAPGTATVDVLSVILADDKGQPLPVTVQGAILTIRSAAQAATQPTATAGQPPAAPTPTLPTGGYGAADTPSATVAATSVPVVTATKAVAAAASAGTPSSTANVAGAGSVTEPITATPTGAPAVAAVAVPTTSVVTTATSEPPAAAAATAVVEVTATATPAREAMAASQAPSGGADVGRLAEPVVAQGTVMASPWFIIIVVGVLIGGFTVAVVLPHERRRYERNKRWLSSEGSNPLDRRY